MKKEIKIFLLSVLAVIVALIITNAIIDKNLEENSATPKREIKKAGIINNKPVTTKDKLAPKDDSLQPEKEAPLPKNTPLLN